MIQPLVIATHALANGEIAFELALPADHPAFDGHFPEVAVLPGVVQVDWAVQLADAHFGLGLGAAQVFQVKYQRVITPHTAALRLTLSLDRDKAALGFRYTSGDTILSSGRITLPS